MYAGGGGIGTSANPLLTSLNGAGLTVITNNPSQVGAAKTYIQNDGTGLKIVNIAAAGGTNDNTVSISSGGSITQTGAINISGAATSGLELLGAGTYTLNGASNNVPILAASLTGAGSLTYVNNAALTLGTVNSTAGITTAGGLANVSTNAAGTLAATGAIATSGGNVTLNSQDALNVNGGITAGAGSVTLKANQDGAGAQGFSQADATTIKIGRAHV